MVEYVESETYQHALGVRGYLRAHGYAVSYDGRKPCVSRVVFPGRELNGRGCRGELPRELWRGTRRLRCERGDK